MSDPSVEVTSQTQLSKGATEIRALSDMRESILAGRADLSEWPAAVEAWKKAAGDKSAEECAQASAGS